MKLYNHQKKILKESPKKCGLWLGTGSGKTRIALLLAAGKILVIAPKTQVEDGNWLREAATIFGEINSSQLYVISKETYRRDHQNLPVFSTVIVDEAHTMLGVTPNVRWRNRVAIPKASQLFEALEQFLERTRPERLYLCTATIMKSPMTVWAATRLLSTPTNFYTFRDSFYTKLPMPGREVWVPRKTESAKKELAEIVKAHGYVGRLEEYFDVPEQTFKTVYVELNTKQKERIRELRLEYPDPLVQIGKRHQIENGVLNATEFSDGEFFDNAKVDKVLEYALEFPRMVIFVKYRAQIKLLEQVLTGSNYKVLTMTGDTKDRGSLIKEANESSECIFIVQAQMSAGWELPEYPVMIFASRTYSWVDYDQAIGRIHRANALKKNLYITLVVKGGIDEAVDKALANKQDFNEKLYGQVEAQQIT